MALPPAVADDRVWRYRGRADIADDIRAPPEHAQDDPAETFYERQGFAPGTLGPYYPLLAMKDIQRPLIQFECRTLAADFHVADPHHRLWIYRSWRA